MTTTATTPKTVNPDPQSADELIAYYQHVRAFTEKICAPMVTEDYVIQSMPDVSPTKWHLAHTTWFFETFILGNNYPNYEPLNKQYNYLFNSYYNAVGEQFCRPRRGQISRPTVSEVYEYRHYVDEKMADLIGRLGRDGALDSIRDLVILGANHEQQHQELMVTDIKHVLSMNPLRPTLYERAEDADPVGVPGLEWLRYEEGVYNIGLNSPRFSFDNEGPEHKEYVNAFEIGSRLVTNGEFLEFMNDGGYQRPDLWLSLGWAEVQENNLKEHDWEKFDKPLYWFKTDDGWMQYTLAGPRRVHPDEPVVHVSYFEADACARWAGARLATESEWEVASADAEVEGGTFSDSFRLHPRPLPLDAPGGRLHQMFGDVWEWTGSAYSPYPGYTVSEGALGEYNGKFMANQIVLRGGSCATPQSHIRPTYRNFFYAPSKWQFMGFRLTRDAE
ncbi:MAG: ergothioneine biosynthesis protein EgtB [Chloroflexi bacterium]|nr:ergothioneine biosynthesis protein EgtB [Chloroflexota bacterium]MCI0836189.1 ergothioneine biosynthesis protein EgtB [Chloroflexota bacterium]MCI0870733.1 ergothioneine biosynthesis protein EgtB [Chloroflexota bacterium]